MENSWELFGEAKASGLRGFCSEEVSGEGQKRDSEIKPRVQKHKADHSG
jgi:hypothetical protein